MAGLFFCLASAESAGLLFCPASIQLHTSVYNSFCFVHAAIIPQTPQSGARGFTVAFPAIHIVLPLLYGGASGYIAPPAPRWSTSQHRSNSSAYQIPPPRRTLYRSAQPPIIIRYIRVRPCYGSMPDGATHHRPCAPAEGCSVSTCTGSARRLAVWHRSEVRAHPPPGGAVQQRRAEPPAACRRISFRAFAR